jgi:hypothetical protein
MFSPFFHTLAPRFFKKSLCFEPRSTIESHRIGIPSTLRGGTGTGTGQSWFESCDVEFVKTSFPIPTADGQLLDRKRERQAPKRLRHTRHTTKSPKAQKQEAKHLVFQHIKQTLLLYFCGTLFIRTD